MKRSFSSSLLTKRFQKTFKKELILQGIGLFSGTTSKIRIKPAVINTGIVFQKLIQGKIINIPATFHNLIPSPYPCTILGNDSKTERIFTVEHLLAAFFGCEIDNSFVEVEGNEIPIFDGSSLPFIEAFEKVGFETQKSEISAVRILQPIKVHLDEFKKGELLPPEKKDFGLSFEIAVDFQQFQISKQSFTFQLNYENFKKEIAPARTFIFQKQLEVLEKNGLFPKGGSLENGILFTSDGKTSQKLRFPNEIVRHKLLDCIGDFSLAGKMICGIYKANYPGHQLNHTIIKKLFSDPNNYKLL